VLWLLPNIPAIASVAVGGLVYLLALIGLGAVRVSELRGLLPHRQSF
jgi:hypothetical protein